MSIAVADFSSLTDDLESIFNENAANALAEMTSKQLFDFIDEERRTHEHLVLHGVAGIKKVAEGADLPRISTEQGDTITATQARYGAIVPVTKDMRKFDLHNQIISLVKTVTQDAFDKVDQSLADVLSYGASTSYTDVFGNTVTSLGPDGKALISATHTNGTTSTSYSNIINDGTNNNPAFSRAAVVNEQMRGRTYTDPNGLVRPIILDTIVCPPSLTDTIERTILSPNMAGTSNNDINPIGGKIKNIITWDRLETTGAGASRSAYWYLAQSKNVKETLKVIFAERPSLDAPEVVYANKDWEYSVDFYYTIMRGFQAYLRQSTGTA